MVLHDFLSIFNKLEAKSLMLLISLKEITCKILYINLFDISHLYVKWNCI